MLNIFSLLIGYIICVSSFVKFLFNVFYYFWMGFFFSPPHWVVRYQNVR